MNNDTVTEIQALIEAMEEGRWDYALAYYLWMLTDFSPHFRGGGFDLPCTRGLR